MPALDPKTMLLLSVGLAALALIAVVIVFAERAAIERTLAEIRDLPEAK